MKKNEMNTYLRLGLFISGVVLGVNYFIKLPEFIIGLGLGVGISLELIGAYSINHDITKIKSFKKNLIRKFVKTA